MSTDISILNNNFDEVESRWKVMFHLSLLFPQRYSLGIFSGYLVPWYFSDLDFSFLKKCFLKLLLQDVVL